MLGDNTHITFNTYMIQSSIWKPKTKGMLELMYVFPCQNYHKPQSASW